MAFDDPVSASKTILTNDQMVAVESLRGEGFEIVRITSENRGAYTVQYNSGDIPAEASGRLRFNADEREMMPAVGDWVAASIHDGGAMAIIHHVLPRRTVLVRKSVGRRSGGQIIAANIDIVFIVQGLDGDFNIRRLERYLHVINASGARPAILLSKCDIHDTATIEEHLGLVNDISKSVQVIAYSAVDGTGIDRIGALLEPGATVCFVGSSGAGKSTLINRLAGGDIFATNEVRSSDSRGRHTTSRRQMIELSSGALLIDTPGMREIGLWDISVDVDGIFSDIAVLAENCRYRDCTHNSEPGCAVIAAVEEGVLDPKRYESYLKLDKEARYIASRQDTSARVERKKRDKLFSRMVKQFNKKSKRKFNK